MPPILTPGARRVLDAATTLFYTHGIAAVGVETIAATAGVTKRTLYDRFGSKEALVCAYLRRRDEEWTARWEERIATAPEPRALTVFDAYAEDAEPSGRGCAFVNAASELADEHPGKAVIREHKAAVRARIEQLVTIDAARADAVAVAHHIFLLAEGAIAQQGVDGDAGHLRRARRLAAELLRR
ncbi:TetR/AcrR family transcriptional regulator [Microbacterium sp. 179-B 1A2 NHS]|uniref:TetR/AcrR family transcriptional regulator n=1 Tax=Microbacterium sp. 179-B 1A2 NHS TaxID=3142383 RepID=UPI0039A0BA1C